MGRRKIKEDDEWKDDYYSYGWGRRPGESDEDYEDRIDDWNSTID